jgi:glycine/D-amino acid oxidase-like deaminating enzyme
MNRRNYDAIIIGGGLAGVAISYHLSLKKMKVLLLEKRTLCSGTSAACAGRAQLIESHSPDYIDLVLAGYSKLQTLGEELNCNLEWEMPGHITLLRSEAEWQANQMRIRMLEQKNIPFELLDDAALMRAEPNLNPAGVAGAIMSMEGHVNAFQLCYGYARAAERAGAQISINSEVTGFIKSAGLLTGVRTGSREYHSPLVIVAGGAWSTELVAKAGSSIPIRFTHAEALITERTPRMIHHHIGVAGFYEAVHGGGKVVALGVGQHSNGAILISNAVQKADEIDQRTTAWGMPALAGAARHVFPFLGDVRILRSWSAPSPFTPDYQPAIGRLPDLDNLYIAAGFHLAVPTIPVLSEAIADELCGSDTGNILLGFRPDRFGSQQGQN